MHIPNINRNINQLSDLGARGRRGHAIGHAIEALEQAIDAPVVSLVADGSQRVQDNSPDLTGPRPLEELVGGAVVGRVSVVAAERSKGIAQGVGKPGRRAQGEEGQAEELELVQVVSQRLDVSRDGVFAVVGLGGHGGCVGVGCGSCGEIRWP